MKQNIALAAVAAATLVLAAPSGASAAGKTYKIYLSNNFVGNDWRQQMERVAEVSVKKGPLAGRVDLKVENAEGTVQAQINSLNNIIRDKPDALLIDGSSAEALNPSSNSAARLKCVTRPSTSVAITPEAIEANVSSSKFFISTVSR